MSSQSSMLVSKNPYTEEIIATYDEMTPEEVERRMAVAREAFLEWRETAFAFRAEPMKRLAELLKSEVRSLGTIATREMGKPIRQARSEVEKCAWVCEYYSDNAERILSAERIQTEASDSCVRFDPLGVIFAVMPWNFPFWQVFRFAAPVVMAGNVGVLKHASNVPQCALAIEDLFVRAGFPEGVFQTLLVGSHRVEGIIRDSRIAAVTLTGSEPAGRSVAAIAGSEIKKTALELGGSDPFIILADADIDAACAAAVVARAQNNGQSCIAAKRFIVVKEIADKFLEMFRQKFASLRVGDPMDEATDVGPMVSARAVSDLAAQVKKSVGMGAKVELGDRAIAGRGYFFPPVILTNVTPGMSAYDEELFGPVAVVIIAADADDAVRIANDTAFGLGASLWTRDFGLARKFAAKIEAGAVFVNGMVKSDPRLPFGGIKRSGYGRELGEYGIKEFVNVKTIVVA